jgi:TRAP transporter TAXI family solute receptor
MSSPKEPGMSSQESRIKSAAATAMAYPFGLRTAIMELFDIGPWVAFTALAMATAVLIAALIYFIHSAPPDSLTITSGPEGSQFYKQAEKYAKILERNGVHVKILPSFGSIENLTRLNEGKADLGLVQTGPASVASDRLISLGSIFFQPLLVFYRGKHLELISELRGKKIAIGPVGSGTRILALSVLALNGINPGEKTTMTDGDAEEAAEGLKSKTLDAAFVMSESSTTEVLKAMMRSEDFHLYSFKQANGYSRKLDYLNVLDLPEGVLDPGKDIPAQEHTLLGPMVELIAVKHLHPALIDLLVEAATEIHGHSGIFQRRGEFPLAVEHSIHLSEDAAAYYKSGKSYLYRSLPFWMASFLSRIFLVFLPVLVVLIPSLRAVPAFFRWIAQLRIRRRYRELRLLEQQFLHEKDAERRELLRLEFDRIDDGVNKMKVRASFADQFYGLRGHIDYVRRIVEKGNGRST